MNRWHVVVGRSREPVCQRPELLSAGFVCSLETREAARKVCRALRKRGSHITAVRRGECAHAPTPQPALDLTIDTRTEPQRERDAYWAYASKVAPMLLVLLAFFGLNGCASLPAPSRSEIAWQALNVIDTGQTVSIARDTRYWEADPVTSRAIGAHPSQGRVYEIMALYAVGHYAISALIDERDPGYGPWHTANKVWSFAGLAWKGYDVGHNFAIGLRPWEGSR